MDALIEVLSRHDACVLALFPGLLLLFQNVISLTESTVVGSVLLLLCHFRLILGKVTGVLSLQRLSVLKHSLCQKKFKNRCTKCVLAHFYFKLLLHSVICVTKCQCAPKCKSS